MDAIARYKDRIAQAEMLGEYGLRRAREDILITEEEHARVTSRHHSDGEAPRAADVRDKGGAPAMSEEAVGCARPTGSVVGAKPTKKEDAQATELKETSVSNITVGRKAPDFVAPAYNWGAFT